MEIPEFIDSKFRLAILAAKRAKQIVAGGKKRIDSDAQNPLTIAIDEIYGGKVTFQLVDETPSIEVVANTLSAEEEDLDMSAKDFLLGTGSGSAESESDIYDDSDADLDSDEDKE